MPEYTLRIRRYTPETGEAAHWDDFMIDLDGHRSVLDGILQARDRQDGTIGIRCSCRAAICGSCGVRINGSPALACHTHLDKAAEVAGDEPITVEPMGNMPVLKDLIVDMDAVHWKKIQRVTPWLLPEADPPEREYVVPPESMIDVTQSMACIQCGACVSDCLSMEVDPEFIGPAALAKAYRFVGDPRDGEHFERLKDLAEDPHGIYDCTHCFNCIEACPKGVAPMSQIMRLRRAAGTEHEINDRNNGHRHERAFVSLVRDYGLLYEAELLPRSYGGDSWFGKFHPAAGMELASSLPSIVKALQRGKVTPMKALKGHKLGKDDLQAVQRIYEHAEGDAYELNLYVVGYEDEEEPPGDGDAQADAAGSHLPEERSPNR
ncbi:MAG TPA: succinate dehydrogenase iron-sulfur subunit [Solirubrobacteraceae bacterium]|jgi:succinate dehydrogenase / fumarate reductase, iron-sulfur subunit|nr:succinate dehydrogenase iron-sulfur subunit [Solirubrobacteraceae bacterium]